MSVKKLEKAILKELKSVSGNKHLQDGNIMEWSTKKCEPQGNEQYAFLPVLGIHVCYKNDSQKKV